MGLSHAAAGAVIFFAAALAGFQVSGDAFDAQSDASEAWAEYHAHQQLREESAYSFVSFSPPGGGASTRTVTLLNSGSQPIDGNLVDLLPDGVHVTITSRSVAGGYVDAWMPGEELALQYTGTKPALLTIVDGLGEKLVVSV